MATQFPERRLIQYDCGNFQPMGQLLHKLKSEDGMMTRMLDILEQFLNFHGHIYLRLDGTTRVDQRQMAPMLDILEQFLNFHGYIYLRLDGTTRVDQRQIT